MSIALYLTRRMRNLLLLGFLSGLPLALSGSTLLIWLTEAGISKTSVGLFAAVATPYALKFLWSPLIDHLPLPILHKRLGKRKSWMVAALTCVAATLFLISGIDPKEATFSLALLALCLSIFSATFDMVVDAYRVEILTPEEQGSGAAVSVFGYRMGMLVSGAGALFLADSLGWVQAYAIMASIVVLGGIIVLFLPEPHVHQMPKPEGKSMAAWLHKAVVLPFRAFITHISWPYVLAFVVLFKLGDAYAGVMTGPFLVDIGFSKTEIASIVKTYGLVATLLGAFIGGSLVHKLSIGQCLLLTGVLQMVSNLAFCVQAVVGNDLMFLMGTITIENASGGMGTAVFVAYLSRLCHREYTATHYALLSSFASFGRTTLSASAGKMAETLGWPEFFATTALIAVPGLLLLFWMQRKKYV